jgi:hypothetical protein
LSAKAEQATKRRIAKLQRPAKRRSRIRSHEGRAAPCANRRTQSRANQNPDAPDPTSEVREEMAGIAAEFAVRRANVPVQVPTRPCLRPSLRLFCSCHRSRGMKRRAESLSGAPVRLLLFLPRRSALRECHRGWDTPDGIFGI